MWLKLVVSMLLVINLTFADDLNRKTGRGKEVVMFHHYDWLYYREQHKNLLRVAARARLAETVQQNTTRRQRLWQRVGVYWHRQIKDCSHDYAVVGR